MAKGQKRGNREAKKPKKAKKPAIGAAAQSYQLPIRPAPSKGGGK